jgi:hypothetical protein
MCTVPTPRSISALASGRVAAVAVVRYAPSDSLVALAKGADVLVHEVLCVPGAPGAPGSALRKHIVDSHTTLEDAGRVATKAGVNAMTEQDVRERLEALGYTTLAADAAAPRQPKQAAARQALAVWTKEHIVTIDDPDG